MRYSISFSIGRQAIILRSKAIETHAFLYCTADLLRESKARLMQTKAHVARQHFFALVAHIVS